MKDLILSLQILMKYSGDVGNPLNCAHDELFFCGIEDLSVITKEDKELLESLGWNIYEEQDEISSFRFGGC